MPSTVLVGAQWGDEGKGKICDLVAGDFDAVVRYSGGNNAGHTLSLIHILSAPTSAPAARSGSSETCAFTVPVI